MTETSPPSPENTPALPTPAPRPSMAAAPEAATRVEHASRPTLWPLWLACFILLLLIGGLAATGWILHERLRADTRTDWISEARLQDGLSSLDQRLEGRLNRLETEVAAKRESLAQLQRQLDDTARRLLTADPTGRTDWLMAEAEYLLRLANQRLFMERDYDGALAILKAADQVLAETREPALYPVRQALASEILQLESVARVDRVGLFLQLEALIAQIGELDQNLFFKDAPLLNEVPAEAASIAAAPAPDWRERALQSLERLERYFVIRHRDEPVEPLLAPDQIYYLQQNLRLMLEQAELALLDRNQTLFDRSLAKAERWIAEYFVTNDAVTQAMRTRLGELRQAQVDVAVPEIGGSLRLLKGLMESTYQRTPPAGDA